MRRAAAVLLGAALLPAACGGGDGGSTPPPGPDRRVAAVEVTPASAELHALGTTRDFEATVRDRDDDGMSGTSVSWTVDPDSVASVDGDGTVTAEAPGAATLEASASDVSGSAAITVDQEVALVAVTPDSGRIEDVGGSLDLDASLTDANGHPVAGERPSWRSHDTAVAAVDTAGLVTGRAEGTAGISARAGGLADTSVVTVAAGDSEDSTSTAVAECSTPEPAWIWCDDFEEDRLPAYFEHEAADGSFVRTGGVGLEGSAGMRARFSEGQVGAGSLHLAFGRTPEDYVDPVDEGTEDYREVYWRLYVRYEEDWTGGGGEKLSRAMILADDDWAQAMIAHVWSGGEGERHLMIDPASGTDEEGDLQTTDYNDFDNLRWLGVDVSETPIFAPEHVGEWHCVEAGVRLNGPGASDGVFRLWIDGRLEAEREGLNWVGSWDDYGINAVFISNYWNDGSPAAQERYIDNLVVSTERIGC